MLFHVLHLKRSDVFLDIGHGVGNTCLQAAYCIGCEARGIEIIKDRYQVSLDFAQKLDDVAREKSDSLFAKTGRRVSVFHHHTGEIFQFFKKNVRLLSDAAFVPHLPCCTHQP